MKKKTGMGGILVDVVGLGCIGTVAAFFGWAGWEWLFGRRKGKDHGKD